MSQDAYAKLEKFVASARKGARTEFRFEEWGSVTWDVDGLAPLGDNSSQRLLFRTDENHGGAPFEEPFASFARALVNLQATSLDDVRYAVLALLLMALRRLYEALPADRRDPCRLTADDFERAMSMAQDAGYEPITLANWASKLEWVSEVMDKRGLGVQPIGWTRSHVFDFESRFTEEAMEDKRARKLLGDEDMLRWAQLSADPGPNAWDRLRQRAVDLMVCGNFRINEVVSLPFNTLVSEPRFDENGELLVDGKGETVQRHGLRYWPSKSEGVPLIRAVPTAMAPVARRAVLEIRALTRRARAVAAAFAGRRTPFDEDPWDILDLDIDLRHDDVGWFLGYRDTDWIGVNGLRFIRDHGVQHWTEIEKFGARCYNRKVTYVRRSDFEEVLREISYDKRRKRSKHGEIPLENCLFAVHRNMGGDVPLDGTCRLLHHSALARYILERYPRSRALAPASDAIDANTTSHMFRFWLHTEALESGVSPLDLSVWSGRRNLQGLRPYDLRSQDDKARKLAQKLDEDDGGELPIATRPDFPTDVADGKSGHASAAGSCRLPRSGPPCRYVAKGIVNGAYAKALDDLDDRELETLRASVAALVIADDREENDKRPHASRWRAANHRLLDEIETAQARRAAVLDEPTRQADAAAMVS